jgi:hypothetical protein
MVCCSSRLVGFFKARIAARCYTVFCSTRQLSFFLLVLPFGESDSIFLAPGEGGIVDEVAAAVVVDGMEGEDEATSGVVQGFPAPVVNLVL